jgi:hypothetical protein
VQVETIATGTSFGGPAREDDSIWIDGRFFIPD